MNNRSFFSNIPPVTKNVLIINLIVWGFAAIVPESTCQKMLDVLGLHYVTSQGFGIWQVITYMFVQTDFWHLFFNMWAVLMFGALIEQRLGSKRYLFYYLSCGVGAAIIQIIVYAIMINQQALTLSHEQYLYIMQNGWETLSHNLNFSDPAMGSFNILLNGCTIGASGAVFGVLLAMGMLYPKIPMYIMFVPYPIEARWLVIGYGLIELFMGFSAVNDGVAHFAHLGGMLFGFIMIWYWKKLARKNGKIL